MQRIEELNHALQMYEFMLLDWNYEWNSIGTSKGFNLYFQKVKTGAVMFRLYMPVVNYKGTHTLCS